MEGTYYILLKFAPLFLFIIAIILDLFQFSIFLNKAATFRELALLPSSGEMLILLGPIEGANSRSRITEKD